MTNEFTSLNFIVSNEFMTNEFTSLNFIVSNEFMASLKKT